MVTFTGGINVNSGITIIEPTTSSSVTSRWANFSDNVQNNTGVMPTISVGVTGANIAAGTISAGDKLIAIVHLTAAAAPGAISVAGFTVIANITNATTNAQTYVGFRDARAGDVASFAATWVNSGVNITGGSWGLICLSNARAGLPISATNQNTGLVTTQTAPTVTPETSSDLLLALFGVDGGGEPYTPPATMTTQAAVPTTSSTRPYVGISTQQLSSVAATGTRSMTSTYGKPYNAVSLCVQPATSLPDGALAAPAAAVQYPTLLGLTAGANLNNIAFATRTPWAVAGVDYAVGPPSATSFIDATSGAVPSGCTRSAATKRIRVEPGSGNVVIDGYDFTAAGVGWYINVISGFTGNLTIKNCKFVTGTSLLPGVVFEVGAMPASVTIQYNSFDGSSLTGTFGYLLNFPCGSIVVEYNEFKNGQSDAITAFAGTSAGNNSTIVRYNLFSNFGFVSSAHTDYIQFVVGANARNIVNARVCYNTFYQPAAAGSGFPMIMSSVTSFGDCNGTTYVNPQFDHNTVVGIGNTGHIDGTLAKTWPALNMMLLTETTNAPSGAMTNLVVTDNYAYTAAGGSFNSATQRGFAAYPFYPPGTQNITGYTYSNNIRMTDGIPFTTTP